MCCEEKRKIKLSLRDQLVREREAELTESLFSCVLAGSSSSTAAGLSVFFYISRVMLV